MAGLAFRALRNHGQIAKSRLSRSHVHAEHECHALAFASGVKVDFTARILHNFLANGETHANAFCILLARRVLQLAKQLEQLISVGLADSSPLVNDMDFKELSATIVAGFNLDGLVVRKFESVFRQVNQDLLEADLIAEEMIG